MFSIQCGYQGARIPTEKVLFWFFYDFINTWRKFSCFLLENYFTTERCFVEDEIHAAFCDLNGKIKSSRDKKSSENLKTLVISQKKGNHAPQNSWIKFTKYDKVPSSTKLA